MSNFVITKEMIEGFCNEGLLIKDMAAKVTELSGKKCSEAVIRLAARHHNINLRKKPTSSAFFIFEDNKEEAEETVEETVNTAESDVQPPSQEVVSEQEELTLDNPDTPGFSL